MRRVQETKRSGFTFVELLVALMVSSIIFSAIASLAFAIGAANDSSTEQSTNQARIRFATIRVSELFKRAKLVTQSGTDDLAIWTSDSNGDNQINLNEISFIETGSSRDHVWLLGFENVPSGTVTLGSLADGSAKSFLISSSDEVRAEIIPQCSNFTFYPTIVTEQDGFVSIWFDITESSQTRRYQISSKLLCRADNLIDGATIVSSDDD